MMNKDVEVSAKPNNTETAEFEEHSVQKHSNESSLNLPKKNSLNMTSKKSSAAIKKAKKEKVANSKNATKSIENVDFFFQPVVQNTNTTFPLSLSSYKQHIYRELKIQVPGITSQEILNQLNSKDFVELETTSDDIILAILCTRDSISSSLTIPPTDLLKQKENEMLDQAILLSEGERDNIELRKRKRKEELIMNCTTSVFEAEEFSTSYLIHPPVIEEASEMKISYQGISSSDKDINNCQANYDIDRCGFLLSLIHRLDQFNCMRNRSESDSDALVNNVIATERPCHCSERRKLLKNAIVKLLYLEKDSIRFHQKHCEKYFLLLNSNIEKEFSSIKYLVLNEISPTPSSTSNVTEISSGLSIPICDDNCHKVIQFLNNEIKILEDNLYRSISDDGNFIPYIFRQCDHDNHYDHEYDISNDGFEIIQVAPKSSIDVSECNLKSNNNDDDDDDN